MAHSVCIDLYVVLKHAGEYIKQINTFASDQRACVWSSRNMLRLSGWNVSDGGGRRSVVVVAESTIVCTVLCKDILYGY